MKSLGISICLLSSDSEQAIEQEKGLSLMDLDVEYEIWNRHLYNQGHFNSFSQVINEAVINCRFETVIFINPKVLCLPNDIQMLIEDLESGFAWTSITGFGFWATTKNVFREIGLLDERFLGGEYEDFDFGIRMKLAKLPMLWRFESGRYEQRQSRQIWPRGVAKSTFHEIWIQEGDQFYRNPDISLPRKFPKSPNGFKNPEQSNAKVKANVYKNGWIVSDFLQNHEFLAKHEKKILLVENQIKLTISRYNEHLILSHRVEKETAFFYFVSIIQQNDGASACIDPTVHRLDFRKDTRMFGLNTTLPVVIRVAAGGRIIFETRIAAKERLVVPLRFNQSQITNAFAQKKRRKLQFKPRVFIKSLPVVIGLNQKIIRFFR